MAAREGVPPRGPSMPEGRVRVRTRQRGALSRTQQRPQHRQCGMSCHAHQHLDTIGAAQDATVCLEPFFVVHTDIYGGSVGNRSVNNVSVLSYTKQTQCLSELSGT
jgi:hypothetical protein